LNTLLGTGGGMKLTKRELQAALYALAKANSRAHIERAKIAEHCAEVYGVDPADVDNEEFIDKCDGGCGMSDGMTADDFDRSMLEYIAMSGIEVPKTSPPRARWKRVQRQKGVALSITLERCPNCGGEVDIFTEADGSRYETRSYMAECSCGFRLRGLPSNCSGRMRDAKSEWNRWARNKSTKPRVD